MNTTPCTAVFDSVESAFEFIKNAPAPVIMSPANFSNQQLVFDFLSALTEAPEVTEVVEAPQAGINPKDALGAAKPNMALVPPAAVLHLAAAMMDGAKKYGPYNWRDNAVQSMVYIAAAQRHISQFLDGEDFDPTSAVHHLGHAMACCAILLDAIETGNLVDTRPTPGAAGDMIRRWSSDTKFS